MRDAPFKNEWIRRYRIKKIKSLSLIRFYRDVAGERLILNTLPWSDVIEIQAKHDIHIKGFDVFYNDNSIFIHTFPNEITIMAGLSLKLDLSDINFVV